MKLETLNGKVIMLNFKFSVPNIDIRVISIRNYYFWNYMYEKV